jgi:hypothetical protein
MNEEGNLNFVGDRYLLKHESQNKHQRLDTHLQREDGNTSQGQKMREKS